MPTGPIGSLLMLGSDLRGHIIDDFVWARMLSQTKIHDCSNVEIALEMAPVNDCGWSDFRVATETSQNDRLVLETLFGATRISISGFLFGHWC